MKFLVAFELTGTMWNRATRLSEAVLRREIGPAIECPTISDVKVEKVVASKVPTRPRKPVKRVTEPAPKAKAKKAARPGLSVT